MKEEYPKYILKNKDGKGGVQLFKEELKVKDPKSVLLIQEFLKHCSITAGDNKLVKIERNILQFADVIEKSLYDVTKKDVDNFLVLLNKTEKTAWTKNEIKIYLKKFLKWKYKDLDMIENIHLDKKPQNHKKLNKANLLTPEEIERLLRVAESLRWKAWLVLAFETGARPQELQQLKWNDIKFNNGFAEITLYSGKTKFSRTVPVQKCVVHLKRWKQEFCYPNIRQSDFVFPSPYNRKKPITTPVFNQCLKLFAKKAGIEKNVWTYLIRHSRLNELYSKLPEQIHKKFAGHEKDSRMTAVYSHLNDDDVKEVMLEKIYNIEEITEETRNKYDKEIRELKEIVKELCANEEITIKHIFKGKEKKDQLKLMEDMKNHLRI